MKPAGGHSPMKQHQMINTNQTIQPISLATISKTNQSSKEALLTSSQGPASANTTQPRLHQKLERATRGTGGAHHQHTISQENGTKGFATISNHQTTATAGVSNTGKRNKGRKNSQNQVMQVQPGDSASAGITQIQLKLFSDGKSVSSVSVKPDQDYFFDFGS